MLGCLFGRSGSSKQQAQPTVATPCSCKPAEAGTVFCQHNQQPAECNVASPRDGEPSDRSPRSCKDPSLASSGFNITRVTKERMASYLQDGLHSLVPEPELFTSMRLYGLLGRGSVAASTFEGSWREGVRVAVKVFTVNSEAPGPALCEAMLCKTLAHPNIVHTYDVRCTRLSLAFMGAVMYGDCSWRNLLQGCARLAAEMHITTTPDSLARSAAEAQAIVQQWSSTMPLWSAGHDSSGSDGYSLFDDDKSFTSQDGFGAPLDSRQPMSWRSILHEIGARVGNLVTIIVMKFCELGTLETAICRGVFHTKAVEPCKMNQDQRRRARAVLRTLREMAQAFEYLEDCNVVHGDLKPANVLLAGSRKDVRGFIAQVADFGLSQLSSCSQNHSNTSNGSIQYMAPELFAQGAITSKSDIYAIGIIMYAMVARTRPYYGMSSADIINQVQFCGLRPTWPEGILTDLKPLFLRCVAQKPADRPCARDVVKELTDIELRLRNDMRANTNEEPTTGKPDVPVACTLPPEVVKPERDGCQGAGQQQQQQAKTTKITTAAAPPVNVAPSDVAAIKKAAASVHTSMAKNRRSSLDAHMHTRGVAQPSDQGHGTASMHGMRHSHNSNSVTAQARLQPLPIQQPSNVPPTLATTRLSDRQPPGLHKLTASMVAQPALGWEPLVLTTSKPATVVQLQQACQTAPPVQLPCTYTVPYAGNQKPAPSTEPSVYTPPMPDTGFVLPRARISSRNEVETDMMQLNALAWPVTLDAEYAEPRSSISL